MTLLASILARLEDSTYRPEEARDEQDARDRQHHNAAMFEAKRIVIAEFQRERTIAGLRELAANARPQLIAADIDEESWCSERLEETAPLQRFDFADVAPDMRVKAAMIEMDARGRG